MAGPPPNDRKRVKVYELRDNDWFDRGTGFCTGNVINDEARIFVESEDQPERMLLETKIAKEDGYQKQQETLIVWTEANGTDMALSFQEAEGCASIWDFVSQIQQHFIGVGPDDVLSDDALDTFSSSIMLPQPELGNLPEVEHIMRAASATQGGRDALSKFIIRDEYIQKLLPLVTVAEDLESLPDLHHLCNIMKSMILLNDNAIIELVVDDLIILGVVGALEYDPDFPTHKANHRQYLADRSRYREVVPIKDPIIRRKIRHTWRLQYLKDVVLARILDDPTFSVLNSLIFFNQVDIVTHLQNNSSFLKELFSVFDPRNMDSKRKGDAVQFLHQCCAIAKNLQPHGRASLFANFINHGLFAVIAFAVKHPSPTMRTTGIDILVALLDHDPIMMRGYMLKAVSEKKTPLTDTLIDLLHEETDLGVKNQLADAIKVLLDPQTPSQEPMTRPGVEFMSKLRSQNPPPDTFLQSHFDESTKRLFAPLKNLETRPSLHDFTFQEVALFAHLVEILTFFVRQQSLRSKSFIRGESLPPRVAQLLTVPQKHLKLTALKFFRTLISLQDTFYHAHMTHNNTFELIINVVYETMPRDNLLNSACLELFEFVRRENIKPIITHVVEKYRDKLKNITYVDTFQNLILRYDQMQGYGADSDSALFSQEEVTPPRSQVNGQRWHGVRGMDAEEEEYFNGSDDEDEVGPSMNEEMAEAVAQRRAELTSHLQQGKSVDDMVITSNGSASPSVKPLVDYPDDDDDGMDMKTEPDSAAQETSLQNKTNQAEPEAGTAVEVTMSPVTPLGGRPPPERLSEKRRREEDEDDDELVKLSSGPKRRSSSVGVVSGGSVGFLGRRKSVTAGSTAAGSSSPSSSSTEKGISPVVPSSPKTKGTKGKQIAISLGNSASKLKTAANKKQGGGGSEGSSATLDESDSGASNNGHSDVASSSNGGGGGGEDMTGKGDDDGGGGSS